MCIVIDARNNSNNTFILLVHLSLSARDYNYFHQFTRKIGISCGIVQSGVKVKFWEQKKSATISRLPSRALILLSISCLAG